MEEIKDRLKKLIDILGYDNPTHFSNELGEGQPKVVGYLKGKNKPGSEFYTNLSLKHPNINLNWLIAGKGNPLLSDDETSDALTTGLVEVLKEQIEGLKGLIKGYEKQIALDQEIIQNQSKRLSRQKK